MKTEMTLFSSLFLQFLFASSLKAQEPKAAPPKGHREVGRGSETALRKLCQVTANTGPQRISLNCGHGSGMSDDKGYYSRAQTVNDKGENALSLHRNQIQFLDALDSPWPKTIMMCRPPALIVGDFGTGGSRHRQGFCRAPPYRMIA
ncbi:hypothetical protein Fuma_06137 [Fuerstiella marisgermanici]|uniref:Uncharacterized protein n=1 Tax=Fuerstiella marisgermanici TaxID=1891926 RepID=A0A1P8WR10_9PLAN|nr:hypothetical protein Fuma_06137 [Fuerstiella marisgermanici]